MSMATYAMTAALRQAWTSSLRLAAGRRTPWRHSQWDKSGRTYGWFVVEARQDGKPIGRTPHARRPITHQTSRSTAAEACVISSRRRPRAPASSTTPMQLTSRSHSPSVPPWKRVGHWAKGGPRRQQAWNLFKRYFTPSGRKCV